MAEFSVLLVEDDLELASLVQRYLRLRGFEVFVEHRGDTAVARFCQVRPDLVVLDIGLPGLDGLQLCKELRQVFLGPIVMLTALDEEADEVLGLEVGADDYLCKPVRPRILLARIRSLLRRHTADGEAAKTIEIGALTIDSGSREVHMRGTLIELGTADFDLLLVLARNAGTVLTRDKLAGDVRGIKHDSFDRSIDLRVSRLRKKLGDDPRKPALIKSVRGVGYLLALST
ncbi:MAG: response regulator [Kofleriaceae bacterium]|nr:response regulator [Kofleriaceae bacterium]